MTFGRKFSRTTSDLSTSFRKISLASGALKSMATDCLPAFTATKDSPIRRSAIAGSAPSRRARSPPFGFSTLITSAPMRAR